MNDVRPFGGRAPSTGGVATALLALAVLVSFCVSPMTLTAIGVSYDVVGGSPLLKIHPANWLFALALLVNWLGQQDLIGYLAAMARLFPGAMLFGAMWLLTVAYASLVQRLPATPLLDTYFAAIAALFLYEGVDERTRRNFALLLHIMLFVNACIGVGEFLTHSRLTPFVAAGAPVLHDYRSTALFGHPLLNAGTSAGYALMLFYGGDPADRRFLKAGLIGVQLAALVAFGGRTAIVLLAVLMALGALPTLGGVVNGRRFDRRVGLGLVFALPLLLGALTAVASGGLFDQFADRFGDDKGSAQARLVIFDLFGQFSLEDILFGPNQERLASLQRTLGIEYGIENSWLGLIFQYGAIMTTFFVVGLLALLGDIMSRSRKYAIVPVIYFLILVSSSASISVKSFSFNQFVILMVVVFGRAVAAPAPARETARTAPALGLASRI